MAPNFRAPPRTSTRAGATPGPQAHARSGAEIDGNLRQMIAVLERERQALASLDADELISASHEKEALCLTLSPVAPEMLDAHTRPLAQTAHQLNEVNRQVRNLLAANVTARLDALGRSQGSYAQGSFNQRSYTHSHTHSHTQGRLGQIRHTGPYQV